jgi:hypothetical protein
MKLGIATASLALTLAATGAAQAASIINGDFSTPNEHGGWGDVTSLTGWVSNTSDSFEVGNSGVYGLGCVTGTTCQNLEVNANEFGSVSQTVTGLTVGDSYQFSWDYGGRAGGGAQQLDVLINGVQIATDNSDGVNAVWTPNSYKFTAGSSSETFTFTSADVGGAPSYGNELTLVSLVAVPEAATWAMMLLGVGMIGGGLRLSRRQNMAATAA